jgi:putative transposase
MPRDHVYTWDIIKLAGPFKGEYFDCYMMVDIHSRCIVGAHVHTTESGTLAVVMMKEIFGIHSVPRLVYADRGISMTPRSGRRPASRTLKVAGSHSIGFHTPANVH